MGKIRGRAAGSDSAAKHTLLIVAGSVLGQGVVVLVTPLLTRTYGASEFAFLAVFTSLTLILGPAIVLRMDAALGLPEAEEDGAAVAWVGVVSALALSVVLAVVGLVFGERIGEVLKSPQFGGMSWLLAFGIFVLALDQISLGWMVRRKRYGAIARRNWLSGVAQAAAQVLFGYLGISSGLVLGLVVGRIVAVGGVLGRDGLIGQPLPSFSDLRRAAARYQRFIYVASWSTLINGLGVQAPTLVISACYGKGGVAALGLAIRVLGAPLAVVGLAVGRVFQGHVAESIRIGRPDLSTRLRHTAVLLLGLGLGPALLLIVCGPALFSFVFGADWRLAGTLSALLAVGLYAQFVVSPLASLPTLLERQGLQIGWDIVRLIATVAVPLVAFWSGAELRTAVLLLGITFALMYASFYLMSDRLAQSSDRHNRTLADATNGA